MSGSIAVNSRVMKIYHHGAISQPVKNFEVLAKEMGVEVCWSDLSIPACHNDLVAQIGDAEGALVIDVASLVGLKDETTLESLREAVHRSEGGSLLLVLSPEPDVESVLECLTGLQKLRLNVLDGAGSTSFPVEGKEWNEVLAGHEYSCSSKQRLTLRDGPELPKTTLMTVNGEVTFLKLGYSNIFIWTTPDIFDMRRPLSRELDFEQEVDTYVPALIFLRKVFGPSCWHTPEIGAGLVIDDPLLRFQYASLNFRTLLDSARTYHYNVTLAFIPWNYRRTRRHQAQWFLQHDHCFRICAHGCDHTRNEFSSEDYDDLIRRNQQAKVRMERHAARTGLRCEPLMVCPQEQYSLTGIRAFAESRQFLALVNTGCIPRRMTEPVITGADLLRPAQDAFFGFPVFKRHYWKDMSVFAMAVFLGKPAILVEHQEFFAEGPGKVEEFVACLKAIAPQVTWRPLEDVVTRTHWRRTTGSGQCDIRFFTDRFHFEHTSPSTTRYRFFKRLPPGTPIENITVNGRSTAYEHSGEDVSFELCAEEPTTFEIHFAITPVLPPHNDDPGLRYAFSVAARRALSEFRDHVISRNRTLLGAGRALANRLKLTGG